MSDINNNGKVEEEFDEETETDQLDNTADLREKLIQIELEDKIEDRDPEIEEFAEKFRKVYEKQFREYLEKLKKNDSIYATSLPTKKYNKETFDEDSMNSINLLFYFDSLDMDENGNINAVVTTTFDRSEKGEGMPSEMVDLYFSEKMEPFKSFIVPLKKYTRTPTLAPQP